MGDSHDDFFPAAELAGSADSGAACGINLYTIEQLQAMDPAAVIAHAVHLQQLYSQIESDNKFLTWEFQEFQENFTYFFRASRLAHKLSATSLDEVAALAVSELPEYFNCTFAALFLYDPSTRNLQLRKSSNDIPVPEPSVLNRERDAEHFLVKMFFWQMEPFIAEYLDSRNVIVADNDERLTAIVPEAWIHLLGPKAMVLPLIAPNQGEAVSTVLGGLIIGNASGKGKLEAKDAEIGLVFSDLLASSLYNAQLLKQLNDLTIIDSLTCLYNRRHLINQLSAAMVRARRNRHALSIAMLDIDHFKTVNDTYGHMAGDRVLRRLGEMLKGDIRAEIDIPARYGGEEFIVIMPDINAEQAVIAAERLRLRIENEPIDFNGIRLHITCSIGVAEFDASENENLERFIDRADIALYHAKKNGRNRVAAAPSSFTE